MLLAIKLVEFALVDFFPFQVGDKVTNGLCDYAIQKIYPEKGKVDVLYGEPGGWKHLYVNVDISYLSSILQKEKFQKKG
mgnify:CR=1 FL=1